MAQIGSAFGHTFEQLPSFVLCGGGVFDVGNSCKEQGLSDWQVAVGSDIGTTVVTVGTGGTGLLIKSAVTGGLKEDI